MTRQGDGGVYRIAASFGHATEEHAAIIEFSCSIRSRPDAEL